jgi:hypothetical protein
MYLVRLFFYIDCVYAKMTAVASMMQQQSELSKGRVGSRFLFRNFGLFRAFSAGLFGSGRVGSVSYRGSAGRFGSGRVKGLVGRVGSGRVGSGRVGSRKMDPWTTLTAIALRVQNACCRPI